MTIQCTSKTTKDNIDDLSKDVDSINKKIKELSIKMENGNTMLKSELTNEVFNEVIIIYQINKNIDDKVKNNTELLKIILENQTKLLMLSNNNIKSCNISTTPFESTSQNNNIVNNTLNQNKIETNNPISSNLTNTDIEPDSNITQSYESLLLDLLNSITAETKDKKNFLNTMKLQLNTILSNFKDQKLTENVLYVNNAKIKKFSNDKLVVLLKYVGFKEVIIKGSKNFEIENEYSEKIEELIEAINKINN